MPNHFRTFQARSLILAFFLLLAVASCAPRPTPAPAAPAATPTVEATPTAQDTATITLSPTPDFSPTPSWTPSPTFTPTETSTPSLTPTITLTPVPPIVSILEMANCRFGPGAAYLYKYTLNETVWMEVIGRNEEGTWLYVEASITKNPCWVKASLTHVEKGSLDAVPVIGIDDLNLPQSQLYGPPEAITAVRNGDMVTILWQAVYMTEDDYRGYLIEAWLCQGGELVFSPLGLERTFARNVDTVGYPPVKDEAGCAEPSHARIYSVEKHGYSVYRVIDWPP